MTNTTKNQPIDTICDGSLKATIWKNPSDNGGFYSVEITRTYQQGETFKDSHSFSGSEILRVARLAHIAYDEIAIYRRQDREATATNGCDS